MTVLIGLTIVIMIYNYHHYYCYYNYDYNYYIYRTTIVMLALLVYNTYCHDSIKRVKLKVVSFYVTNVFIVIIFYYVFIVITYLPPFQNKNVLIFPKREFGFINTTTIGYLFITFCYYPIYYHLRGFSGYWTPNM